MINVKKKKIITFGLKLQHDNTYFIIPTNRCSGFSRYGTLKFIIHLI